MLNDPQKRIQELEEEVSRLQKLVTYDELTNALNRRGLLEKLESVFKEALYLKEHPESKRHFYIDNLSVIFIDVDNFKKINDNYGHATGDEVLKAVTALIKDEVREIDFVGRLGGEEFVVALLGASEEDAFKKAERIRKRIHEEKFVDGFDELVVTISVGVASIQRSDSKDATDLIAMADQAMYEAKTKRGKNNVVRYSEIS